MFGYIRFFLAFLVLLSHTGVRIYGLNPGVTAVVIFYILAGYVVARLWHEILPKGPGMTARFFRDRVLRIMPLYLYVCVLTLGFLAVTGYGDPVFSPISLAGNLLVIPVNYFMVLDTTVMTNPAWCLIPPAWSLGAELQAYLLLPLALVFRPVCLALAAVSFAVYMLANLSVLHPDYFGYRLVFGVFFIFVTGTCLSAGRQPAALAVAGQKNPTSVQFDHLFPWVVWSGIGVAGFFFLLYDFFSPAYTRETFLGLFAGIPLVYTAARVPWKLPGNRLLGALSYGVFLSHFLVIWALDHAGITSRFFPAYIVWVTAGSVCIAWTGTRALETRVDKVRKFPKK